LLQLRTWVSSSAPSTSARRTSTNGYSVRRVWLARWVIGASGMPLMSQLTHVVRAFTHLWMISQHLYTRWGLIAQFKGLFGAVGWMAMAWPVAQVSPAQREGRFALFSVVQSRTHSGSSPTTGTCASVVWATPFSRRRRRCYWAWQRLPSTSNSIVRASIR